MELDDVKLEMHIVYIGHHNSIRKKWRNLIKTLEWTKSSWIQNPRDMKGNIDDEIMFLKI